ncbi:MAG: hypothetical protein ACOWWR_17470 [Eubacteriales bacterium]
MNNKQSQIADLLKSLEHMEGTSRVKVDVTDTKGTITISDPMDRIFSLRIVLRWSTDHYIGYFADQEWNEQQAQFSLWSLLDAGYFASAYSLLYGLRAKREDHL